MKSLLAAVALLFLGCAHVIPGSLTGGDPFDFALEHPCAEASDRAKVQVTYLGSGGVYIRWGDEAILLGASFSNHHLLRAAFWLAAFDKNRIAGRLRLIEPEAVCAVLAGHSHYDHIGDVPELGLDVPVWVNRSGANMLAAYPDLKVNTIEPGRWIDVSPSIRVRAIVSGHAPQVLPCRRWPCVYAGGESPQWKRKWERHFLHRFRGGETYAFVIELRNGGETRYRIYYNDAAADSPLGQVVDDFDLAILTIAQWNWVRDYPRDLLLTLQPKHVLISHWDDFMRKDDKTAKFIPTMRKRDVDRFLRIVNEHVAEEYAGPSNAVCGVETPKWTMPVIGSSLLFDPR
jgi:hypothetical protein